MIISAYNIGEQVDAPIFADGGCVTVPTHR